MGINLRRIVVAVTLVGAIMASTVTTSLAYGGGDRGDWNNRPSKAVSYINPDTGAPTANPDVDPNSSCKSPDREDTQKLSDAGTTNRNVHNDACLFSGYSSDTRFDGKVSWDAVGVGVISACPDPDGTGPKTATLLDTNGDGRNDRCLQTGFQTTGKAGDTEYHVRLNNVDQAGEQRVIFCYDPEQNGCGDTWVKANITVHWVK